MAPKFLNGKARFPGKYNKEMESYGFAPLEDIDTVKGSYYVEDKDGYKYYASLLILRRGYSPLIFTNVNKYTIDNLKLWIIKNNLPYKVLSEGYVGTLDNVLFNCPIHGDFEKEISYFVHKRQFCSKCANNGIYNINKAEQNKQKWEQVNAKVYVLKIYDGQEEFYKIGITTREIKVRFSKLSQKYKYEVLKIYELSLYDAVYLEKELHDKHGLFSYAPLKDIGGGHTECFSVFIN